MQKKFVTMSEKTKSAIYITGIILLFVLLLVIIWLVYNYQIHKLDKAAGNVQTIIKPALTTKVSIISFSNLKN
jgi:hypothetical protein